MWGRFALPSDLAALPPRRPGDLPDAGDGRGSRAGTWSSRRPARGAAQPGECGGDSPFHPIWLRYRRADRVICQTRAMAEDLAQELGLPEDRLAVLPNPVNVEEIRHSIGLNPAPQTGARTALP